MWMLCSAEAEWYCHPQKCGNGGDTQSVENQVAQDEEPAEDIIFFRHIVLLVLNQYCIPSIQSGFYNLDCRKSS